MSQTETYNDAKWIDGVVLRRASRKRWLCSGDGARRANHAAGCSGWIERGQPCAEYLGETPAYQTGTHHSLLCADAFLTRKEG